MLAYITPETSYVVYESVITSVYNAIITVRPPTDNVTKLTDLHLYNLKCRKLILDILDILLLYAININLNHSLIIYCFTKFFDIIIIYNT